MTWWVEHPEHIETLRTMARRGAPASEVAEALGCTRNAVISAARRYGITLKQGAYGPPRPRGPRKRRKKTRASRPAPEKYKPRRPPEPPWPCSLMELTNFSCRWPHGNVGSPEFYFCGAHDADVFRGRPYCRTHSALAYNPRN
jgi:GcrA cell cycle regulator